MALKSERHETVVNPDNGIYVEMEQIMEVRFTSDDPDFHRPPEDFKVFQERVREIPENFCHKDRETTEQAVFFCLVCNCDLKSLKPLRDHVTGNKHIRKACDFKRQIMGIPNQPQNAPKVKNIKKSRPRVDIGQSLTKRLQACGEPAIGLEYITEYINPRNEHDHRMYTCKLEGCKSAWGTSDDIFNHVIRPKHHKNFFRKMNPDDPRVAGMTSADILTKAAEWEEREYPDGERDYSVIVQRRDYEEYMELRHRPDDWSEKKAALGIVGNRFNSNMEPLGSRKRKTTEPPMFDPVAWRGWQPKTFEQAAEESRAAMRRGVDTVVDMVENFKGKIGDDEHKEVLHYNGIYKQLLGMLTNELGQAETAGLIGELDRGMGELQSKLELEETERKEITKLMAELEEEINKYHSDRTTNKYNNIRARMSTLTKKMGTFKPGRVENQEVKVKHNKRLGELWKEFETRSDSMVEILEQQMGAPPSTSGREEETLGSSGGRGDDRKGEARKAAVEKYRLDLTQHVKTLLERNYGAKFVQDEASRYATYLVKEKYLNAEVNQFTKKGAPWSEFKLTEKTKEAVKKHLDTKMSKYKAGDVNNL